MREPARRLRPAVPELGQLRRARRRVARTPQQLAAHTTIDTRCCRAPSPSRRPRSPPGRLPSSCRAPAWTTEQRQQREAGGGGGAAASVAARRRRRGWRRGRGRRRPRRGMAHHRLLSTLSAQLSLAGIDELGRHESGDEGPSAGVEVVVLQTATSVSRTLVRRSAAGDAAAGEPLRLQQQWAPPPPRALKGGGGERADRQQPPAARRATAVLLACAAWVLSSSGAILVNKHIMVDLHFPYPATVGALGMLGTSVLALAAARLARRRGGGGGSGGGRVSLRFYLTHFMPTGLFQALSMALGNTAYLHLSVAFVQMLKAFTPVATMLFAFAFGLERPSVRLVAAVGVITLGVAGASAGEGALSLAGVAAMLGSMLCEGLRLVMMQALVAKRALRPLDVLAHLAPAASLWMLLLAGATEALAIHQGQHLADAAAHPAALAGSAIAGAAVNGAAMAVIALCGALPLKLLGLAKDVGLVALGVAALGETVGRGQAAGYAASVAGLVWYYAIAASAARPGGGGGPGGGGPGGGGGGGGRPAEGAGRPLRRRRRRRRRAWRRRRRRGPRRRRSARAAARRAIPSSARPACPLAV
ncbi:sugar phosphate/phosphate translocator [Scenedesmus sp. PABB004]|nr:sugar phosphate/phosphate translocator [Scenedesmus sp. PABB004]